MTKNLQEEVEVFRDWKRRHPGFPLTVHPRGLWSKKIRGHVHYFGRLDDPDAALALWLKQKDYLLAGLPVPVRRAGLTVRELLAKHLADVDDRIRVGKLVRKTRGDYVVVARLFSHAKLAGVPVKALTPEHFATLQRSLEDGRGLSSQKNVIMDVKAVFNWGRRMELFDEAIRYGPRFIAPTLNAIEAEREKNGRCRFFERELLLAALTTAKPKMRVAILLGINCAFYPSDTVTIPLNRLHLAGEIPYHDFRRAKTGQRRMAVLWAETVEAIEDYRNNHRRPKKASEQCLLLSRRQVPYSPQSNGSELIISFSKLLDGLGDRPPGASLGSLRHTYATVVDLVPDQAMIDLTMGHVHRGLQRRVYRQLNLHELERLQVVAEAVRRWLFEGVIQQGVHV